MEQFGIFSNMTCEKVAQQKIVVNPKVLENMLVKKQEV